MKRMARQGGRGQISATTFIFFMILGVVVAGAVIRTFLVPAATTFEQGQLTKSVANLKGAFADVCAGRSAGREVVISVPSKDGVFLFHSCGDLIDTVTAISPINGKPLPSTKVDELKGRCSATPDPEKWALLAYGWDRSWNWWLYHESDVEIKSELLDCGKNAVHARVDLGGGDYKRFMLFESDPANGAERVIMVGGE